MWAAKHCSLSYTAVSKYFAVYTAKKGTTCFNVHENRPKIEPCNCCPHWSMLSAVLFTVVSPDRIQVHATILLTTWAAKQCSILLYCKLKMVIDSCLVLLEFWSAVY